MKLKPNMDQMEKMKTHFRENQKIYIAAGIGVAVGITVGVGGTWFFSKHSDSGAKIVQKITPVLSWRPESTNVVVALAERSTPSKPVHLLGTDLYFASMNDAARKTGHSLTQISKNVNGLIPDIQGDVFELLTPAA